MTDRIDTLKWLLVDQIEHLTISTKSIREKIENHINNATTNETIWFIRMCKIFLINTLAKLFEVIQEFGKEINNFPDPLRTELVKLRTEIESRKIYQYRNKYGCHILDKSTKRPISIKDGEALLSHIYGETFEDLLNFCDWVCPCVNTGGSKSVMHWILEAKNHCLSIAGSTQRP